MFVLVASGQVAKAPTELKGTVIDQLGALIPDTRIVLTETGGKKFETMTGEEGEFKIRVPAGTYLLEAEYSKHKAWEKFKIDRYEIAATRQMLLDICLKIDETLTKPHIQPIE